MIDSLKSFSNNKSPGNDGLNKELYKAFWDELKLAKPKLAKNLLYHQGKLF